VSLILGFEFAGSGSTLFWVWAVATLVLAAGLGFVAGVSYSGRASDRGLRKAAKTLTSLYALVLDSLENSQKIVALLEGFPKLALSVEQVERLESKRSSLLETVGRIIGAHRESSARQVEAKQTEDKLKARPKPFKMPWKRDALDSHTGLPDRASFDANLALMLDLGTRAEQPSGLLLVRIDRMDQLKSRFGIAGSDAFMKDVAALLAQCVREQDLTCRLASDTFAVLIPGVDAENGRKLSQAVRNAVRVHNFRIHDGGPEVLVTASFGFTGCPPHDNAEAALGRAGDALAQSTRRGRNQLHVYDGAALVHCATS
jgi:diguanylate cyclase (GGDEF)-like protein